MSPRLSELLPVLIASAAEQKRPRPGRILDPFRQGMIFCGGAFAAITYDGPLYNCVNITAGTSFQIYPLSNGEANEQIFADNNVVQQHAVAVDRFYNQVAYDAITNPNDYIYTANLGLRVKEAYFDYYRLGDRIIFNKSLSTAGLTYPSLPDKDYSDLTVLVAIKTDGWNSGGRIFSFGINGADDQAITGHWIPLTWTDNELPPRMGTFVGGSYVIHGMDIPSYSGFDVYSCSARENGTFIEFESYGSRLDLLATQSSNIPAGLGSFDIAGITNNAGQRSVGSLTGAPQIGLVVVWDNEQIDLREASRAVYDSWPGFTPSHSFLTPLNEPNCRHYWDANRSPLTIVDANRVQQIDNIRSDGSDLIQDTVARRPTLLSGGPGGKNYLRFEAVSNQVIKNSAITPVIETTEVGFTIFVYRWTSTTQPANGYAWQGSAGFGGCFRADNLGTSEEFGGTETASIGRAIDTDWHIQYAYQPSVGSALIWVDGGAPFTANTTQFGGYSQMGLGATSAEAFPADMECMLHSMHNDLPSKEYLDAQLAAYTEELGIVTTPISGYPT